MSRSAAAAILGLCAAFGLAGCAAPVGDTLTLNPLAIQTGPVGAPIPSLVGATASGLTASFGAPVLRRVDGAAQVWLYHSPTCGLNLILYPDAGGIPRVADAVPDNGNADACVLSLRHNPATATLERAPAS